MSLNLPNTIANDTAANGEKLEENFTAIETHINTELIHRDGSIPMVNPLTLSATAPSAANHAVRLSDLDTLLPPGMIVDYGGASAPAGWLLCDGAIYEQGDHPGLFAVIGSTYDADPDAPGGPVGGTQFRVPYFTDRTAIGVGANSLGAEGGSADAVVASHIHTMPSHSHSDTFSASSSATGGSHGHTDDINSVSAFTSHEHLPGDGSQFAVFGGGVNIRNFTVDTGSTIAIGRTPDTNSQPSSSHDHVVNGGVNTSTSHAHTVSTTINGTVSSVDPGDTNSTGVDPTNANLPPFLAVNKIIKAG